MTKKNPDDGRDPKSKRRRGPKLNKRNLDSFLASICEAGGMSGHASKPPEELKVPHHHRNNLTCQGPCAKAEWRSHLDIPAGVLCVSAVWSQNKHAEKHRDVTIGVTFRDERGKTQYNEMVFCDSEVRWLMETIWHAPIWD